VKLQVLLTYNQREYSSSSNNNNNVSDWSLKITDVQPFAN
jgi:hypothetical protein